VSVLCVVGHFRLSAPATGPSGLNTPSRYSAGCDINATHLNTSVQNVKSSIIPMSHIEFTFINTVIRSMQIAKLLLSLCQKEQEAKLSLG